MSVFKIVANVCSFDDFFDSLLVRRTITTPQKIPNVKTNIVTVIMLATR